MLCSFGIAPYCLQVVLLLLPSLVSCLLVGVVAAAIAAEVAESLSSCCSPITDLGGPSILNFTCQNRGCSAFDSC